MTALTKMYCYKIFRQKSLYVIMAIIVGMMLITRSMPGQRTFSALLCESGPLILMLPPLFTAMFFSAEYSSGFIKNYAGTVPDRLSVIGARSIIAVIVNLLASLVMTASGLLMTRSTGSAETAVLCIVCMFLSGLGISFAALLVTELFRKTVPSVIMTLAIGTGILCELVSTIVGLISNGSVIIKDKFLSGALTLFGETQRRSYAVKIVVIALIYIAAALVASAFSIKKRDIV